MTDWNTEVGDVISHLGDPAPAPGVGVTDPNFAAAMIAASKTGSTDLAGCLAFVNSLQNLFNNRYSQLSQAGTGSTGAVVYGIYMDPPASKGKAPYLFPQPTDFPAGNTFKKANGQSYPPSMSNADKVRATIAEDFDRMTRIYMAGTDQLNVDYPDAPFNAKDAAGNSIKMRGMYQGFKPDLLNSSLKKVIEIEYDQRWGDCSSGTFHGVANPDNATHRWFKSPNQSVGYQDLYNNGNWYNTVQCYPGKPGTIVPPGGIAPVDRKFRHIPKVRGLFVDASMTLAKNMIQKLKAGVLYSPESFFQTTSEFQTAHPELLDPAGYATDLPPATQCEQMRSDLEASRSAAAAQMTELMAGIKSDAQKNTVLSACTQQANNGDAAIFNDAGSDPSSSATSQFNGNQARICLVEAARIKIERATARLAFCTWQFTVSALLDRITHEGYRVAQTEKLMGAIFAQGESAACSIDEYPGSESSGRKWIF